MINILPQYKLFKLLSYNVYPNQDPEYIISTYNYNPHVFTLFLNKAQNNANRKGFGGREYSLWIAANLTQAVKNRSLFCYYCLLDLNSIDLIMQSSDLEHFIPKKHEPANISIACRSCNELKADKDDSFYLKIINSRQGLEGLDNKQRLFTPMVLRHFGLIINNKTLNRMLWLELMKEYAISDFQVSIEDDNRWNIASKYGELFRNRYYNDL